MCVFIFLVKVTEWPPIGKIAAHSAYEMFSWYHYLIFGLVFSHLGFWSGNLFLIAPFPDLFLLEPSNMIRMDKKDFKTSQRHVRIIFGPNIIFFLKYDEPYNAYLLDCIFVLSHWDTEHKLYGTPEAVELSTFVYIEQSIGRGLTMPYWVVQK